MLTLEPLDLDAAVAWHADMTAEADRLDLAYWGRSWGRADGDHATAAAGYEAFEVRRDGVAIGRLGLREERVERGGWDNLHIDSLWVAPESRGRGHGRQLVLVAASEARRRRARALQLNVAASNAPALRVYRALSFVELSSVRLFDPQRTPYRPVPVTELDDDTSIEREGLLESTVVSQLREEGGVFFVSRRRRDIEAILLALVDADQRVARVWVLRLAPGAEKRLPGLSAGIANGLRERGVDVDHLLIEVPQEWNDRLPSDDFPRHSQVLGLQV